MILTRASLIVFPTAFDQPGSNPLALSTAAAAGVVRNLITARAASPTLLLAATAPVETE